MNDYKKILVGIDFSGTTERLIEKAVKMSIIFNAEISIVHVIDYLPPTYVASELPSAFVSEAVLVDIAKRRIAKLTGNYPNTEFDSHVVIGHRKKSIVEFAEKIGADLAVLGKHDSSTMDRYLGSTALGVINRSGMDVLVVHI